MIPAAQQLAIMKAAGRLQPEIQRPDSLWDDVAIAKAMNDPALHLQYLTDLNAMHAIEMSLSDTDYRCYEDHLCDVLAAADEKWANVPVMGGGTIKMPCGFIRWNSPTAAQRAKAYLLFLGKWDDSL